ncbi:MAG: ATP:cob(I)alamin adenosyltransferase [Candidatus Levybacteria bacterium RIFCSPHIGHO2_01_FULL_36_15b]|nr:MAG: ATP:cob(I)alamin adenosyltransferase [Candidatus Levybacteria bacterium RIFCSPHIGHO2_01_FULL_36_15b]
MVKIYTKTGDRGTTSLFGGERVSKDSLRIDACGNVDELNSLIGVIVPDLVGIQPLSRKLLRVQAELFVLGSDLATPIGSKLKVKVPRVKKSYTTRLEKEIDDWDKNLAPLKKFILPGGAIAGANLHLARTVARRTERAVASLASQEKINQNSLIYINRLSDWLFILARYVNKLDKVKEVPWQGRGKS